MNIIIADDHPLVQEALGNTLRPAFPECRFQSCFTLKGVIEAVAEAQADIDLVLLDLDMPDSQGFAGLFQLLSLYPTVPVAILSAAQDPDTIHHAMDYGASGYVPKSIPLRQMVEAIRAILDGEPWIPSALRNGARVPAHADTAEWARRFASLSTQQMRILMMVREGRLNKQIAGDLGIAEQTVKVHVSTILRKLNVGSRTQAAVAADRLIVKD